ncbi:MAG TPA: DUF3052 domain-containing protein [Thermoanaerobaculia bacterium]|nr:DUF3052 domain-containing protein [Thermoanaerobaculia bacterium]
MQIGKESGEAKALLETEELIVRGAVRAKIPFRDVKDVRAEDGVLALRWNDRDVRIHAGKDAAKWAEKIRNPKSVADKLGVKSGQKISVVGALDAAFLEGRDADVSKRLRKDSDLIFLAANRREDLSRLDECRDALASNGAVWVIRPKGIDAITERDVLARGKEAGLVDVKVVKFSETHTAEKFVIPVEKRVSKM